MQYAKTQKLAGGDGRGTVSKSAKQFPWCESRPDGRRAIKNHQEAHGRAIKNARNVVDTSIPKYFKTKLMRGKRSTQNQSNEAAAAMGSSSCAKQYFDNVQHRVMLLRQNGLGGNYWRPGSAPASGRNPADLMSTSSRMPRALASPISNTNGRAASVASHSPQQFNSAAAPSTSDDAALSQFDRLSYNFTESQHQIFDSFVQMLSAYQIEDMNTITSAALQEASEKRLFANYRS
eukprot:TRINITY_DN13700_c0_g1_i1.p1 TRINITY_DN13700_c0_g1~~TRINITY_DN13700_c0_g1_i1.p1  ORF type:complete len:234 (+),score=36.76 TRINITY_DN13700_c0_g1_i1:48-749(+)